MSSTPKSAYTPCLSPCAANSLARAGNRNEGITYKLGKLLGACTSAHNMPSVATLSRFKSEASDFKPVTQASTGWDPHVDIWKNTSTYLIARVLASAHQRMLQRKLGTLGVIQKHTSLGLSYYTLIAIHETLNYDLIYLIIDSDMHAYKAFWSVSPHTFSHVLFIPVTHPVHIIPFPRYTWLCFETDLHCIGNVHWILVGSQGTHNWKPRLPLSLNLRSK